MVQVLALLFYLLLPAAVIWCCNRNAFMNKVGEILILYFVGIVVGNLIIYPLGFADALKGIQDILTTATILIAIPMVLFGCDFKRWPVKKSLVALCIGLVSVVVMDVIGFYIFRDGDANFNSIAGLLVGVYTGGTPNLASLKMALNVEANTYIFVHTFDMVISFLYLIFLMLVGIRIFRFLLHSDKNKKQDSQSVENTNMALSDTAGMYKGIFTKKHFPKALAAFGLSLLIAALSAGCSFLFTGQIDNMLVLILTMTTLSIGASFLKPVRKMGKSYDVGMYFVLVFSLVVASMVDVTSIDYRSGLNLIGYIAFVIFCSLCLSILLAKIFKVDADTMVITSVALINSPLFVPMIAQQMKNREVIITGVTVGVIGYAVGNYLGIIVSQLLG